jgi:hypothetical protein
MRKGGKKSLTISTDKIINTEETIAEALARIELKLDAILIKLEWTPRAEAEWYAQTTLGGAQEPPSDGQG